MCFCSICFATLLALFLSLLPSHILGKYSYHTPVGRCCVDRCLEVGCVSGDLLDAKVIAGLLYGTYPPKLLTKCFNGCQSSNRRSQTPPT